NGVNGRGSEEAKREAEPETKPKNEALKAAAAEQQPEPQNGSESPVLAKVRTRLEESKISEPEFLDILRCAQIAEATGASTLADIPDKTLQLAIGSWDTVVDLAGEFRKCKGSKEGIK